MTEVAVPEEIITTSINYWEFIIVIGIILVVLAFILFMLLYFRKFYKPTKRKIIITLISTAIIEFILFWGVAQAVYCTECMTQFCPPCVNYDGAWTAVKVTTIPLLFIIYSIICLIHKIFRR